jgi:HAD superfamily hydrolase (TIGR01509 family)
MSPRSQGAGPVNVVFDLAGVLVDYDQPTLIAEVFGDPGTCRTVLAEIIGHEDWLTLDRGTLTQEDVIMRAARRTGLALEDIGRFFDRVSTAWAPVPGTIDLLRRVRARGHPLFCLSNMHPASWAYLERSCDFWELFSGITISCHVQLIKPEPAIYAHLLARHGLDGPQTVFVDDRDVNLAAAARFGIQTIKFETPAQCEIRLRALGCL